MGKTQKFISLGACIFISFFLFGVAQEKVTKATYINPDGNVEYFSCSMSLVLIYCGTNYLLSLVISRFIKEDDSTPTRYFCFTAFVYFLAMVCAIIALQFINYPTQVIAKSCKPIPVLIFGVLLGKRSYSFKKYIFVGMVVMGVIMFLYKDAKESKKEIKPEDVNLFDKKFNFYKMALFIMMVMVLGFGVGELLVLSSLFMDGIIAALQERMRGDFQTKPISMMTNMNKWATVYLVILSIVTKELFKFSSFVQRHPTVIWKLFALSICGFFGQLAMIMTVVEFGTLPATMIATVRKFFTVLTSVLLLGNSLILRQWIATVIIFSGLFLDILYGKSDTKVK